MTNTSKGAPVESISTRRFVGLAALAVVVGAAIRFAYISADDRPWVGGDGFTYHFEALRLADGLGYTSALGDIGHPIAHHPPGWVTVLGAVSWLGGRSLEVHQVVAAGLGLVVVVLAGLVAYRVVGARAGVVAAFLAALYPGFWVIEAQVLSEPLGLVVLGIVSLLALDLPAHPTVGRSLAIGAICGVLALARSEQIAVFALVVVPLLLTARALSPRQRLGRVAVAALALGVVITPWTVYNASRFDAVVLLSTNGGGTMLAGNCPPFTYAGEYLGYYKTDCTQRLSRESPGLDRAERDPVARRKAIENALENVDRLPVTIAARIGRLLAVFRPSQTVGWVASWQQSGTAPVWAWITSYWVLCAAAIVGVAALRRDRRALLVLGAPLAIVGVLVVIAYGEPRYHIPADLAVIVFAAAGIDRMLRSRSPQPPVPVEERVPVLARARSASDW